MGVSCRILYFFVVYLYVRGSGSVTSVWEERANLSVVFTWNYVRVSLGALDGLRYFIVALSLPYTYS